MRFSRDYSNSGKKWRDVSFRRDAKEWEEV